jgi:hypothetical protein
MYKNSNLKFYAFIEILFISYINGLKIFLNNHIIKYITYLVFELRYDARPFV